MNDDLLRYESGLMDVDEAHAFEERLFSDAALQQDAARLEAVRVTLGSMAGEGLLVPVVDEAGLDALRARTRLTEYHFVDGRLEARLGDVDYVVAHVDVDLGDARRIDVELCAPDGTPYFRVHEAPFSERGVIIACQVHVARMAGTLRVRVLDERSVLRADVAIVNREA